MVYIPRLWVRNVYGLARKPEATGLAELVLDWA